ncbi:Putative uncharacterized protein [Lactococcus lactis subsp. lactis A12]|uniref:Uncharacterized protein n=1 Tax=Lactococcus lactis subsp. lactis A12 TaxID=1137134 RepID=S6F3L2_LACLL|nr:Putative uncharacterized protein [Lactococcus lactis subsp. lactis A12]
MENQLNFEVV